MPQRLLDISTAINVFFYTNKHKLVASSLRFLLPKSIKSRNKKLKVKGSSFSTVARNVMLLRNINGTWSHTGTFLINPNEVDKLKKIMKKFLFNSCSWCG